MICVVIKGPTFKKAYEQISQAKINANIVELRLDLFESINFNEIKTLRTIFSIPMIFTIKSTSQIEKLATLKPDYFDLEHNTPKKIINKIMKQHPEIKIIASMHDFIQTPPNLDKVLETIKQTPAHIYKIATMTNSSLDALRLLCLAKKSNSPIIVIGMGQYGHITRILNTIIKSPFTYASLNDNLTTVPNQLSIKTLLNVYNYKKINNYTKIYGLIGNPIEQSISDVSHNNTIKTLNLNAIYIKIPINPNELAEFFTYAKELDIKGLSVTMPLKEAVVPYLNTITPEAKKIGAVNTIKNENGFLTGYNTDAIGSLKAIQEKEKTILNKKIIIIGAGGAAKAIAFEMKKNGAIVSIINRTKSKAQKLSKDLGCDGNNLEHIKIEYSRGYDIIVNCTPSAQPIDLKWILPKSIVMDITTKPKNTEFLQSAKNKECKIIYGHKMFEYQATEQFKIWFKAQQA